jgi:phage shock protein A
MGDSSSAFDRLDRLEEKIQKDEATAAAYEDMAGVDNDLDERLASLGSTSAADKLAALKAKNAGS